MALRFQKSRGLFLCRLCCLSSLFYVKITVVVLSRQVLTGGFKNMDNDSVTGRIFDIISKPSIYIISGYARLSRFFGTGPVIRLITSDPLTQRRYTIQVAITTAVATSAKFDDFIISGQATEIIRISNKECYDIGTEVNCHLSYNGEGKSSLTFIPRRG
jgi:hypothetical protein